MAFDISDLPLTTPAEINIARQRLENILAQTDEIQYANDQCNQWQEIADYMSLLIKGGGKLVYDEDNAIEVPKDETPAYLEWTLWRAALAIDHMMNKPYEVRGFKLDSDFMPVSAAGGGKGDLYCEFDDFTILTEVTMSTSSRQEAMEGEPVRRHVSDAVLKYEKPVYGMFIAVRIDTNTAETFRHGIWYAKGDMKQRLDIVPLTLEQFQKYFVAMFEGKQAKPEHLRDLILECETKRDILDAPDWKQHINTVVTERAHEVKTGIKRAVATAPIVSPGAMVRHVAFGVGQVVGLMASFPGCQAKTMELPYLRGLPDEVSMESDGKTLHHERFGKGSVHAYDLEHQITLDETIIAQACSSAELSIVALAKGNIGALTENIEKPPYKSLFNSGTNSFSLYNGVQVLRTVDRLLKQHEATSTGRKRLVLVHGNRFLLHLILGKIKATDGFGTKYLSNECIATLVNEHFQTQWDSVFDAMEAKFPDAYPSYLFRNVGKLKELVEVIAR